MFRIASRRRTLAGVLVALAAAGAGAVAPHAAQAATCTGADTPLVEPVRRAGESDASYSARYQGLRRTVRDAIVCLTNNERTARGLAPLAANVYLHNTSNRHAIDMVRNRYFSHTGLNGSTYTQRASAAGYCPGRTPLIWENIYFEYPRPTARSVISAWMNSPGHRANILDRNPREIGVGVSYGTHVSASGGMFVQMFGLCR